eukprot:TRINITY_DN39594_c0_g1_i1.p1 TRINITY_DN39594_c0_g1~~TRINITY_DN39594_c0_g1_i1.p1  ORF type:complete len:419 (-),score=83.43 TRINITY_DN39594_c0_g1_i1:199-1455(-)
MPDFMLRRLLLASCMVWRPARCIINMGFADDLEEENDDGYNPSYNACNEQPIGPSTLRPPPWDGRPESFFEDYRPLSEVDAYIDGLARQWPQLVQLETIGTSSQGRPLRLLEITANSETAGKPVIFLQGGIHAREWIAITTVLHIATTLLQKSDATPVSELLHRYVFAILAPLNPDGYVHTWESNRMWRKTMSQRSDPKCPNNVGVDANRNWDFAWGKTKDKQYLARLHDPCGEVYIGPEPFSEPELAAVAEYLRGHQMASKAESGAGAKKASPCSGNVAAFLDYHADVQMLLPPFAFKAQLPSGKDGEYIEGLCKVMVNAMKKTTGHEFKYGADLLSPDPGTGPDWAYGALGIRAAMTIELESPGFGFCVPKQEIGRIGDEQFHAVLAMMQFLQKHGTAPSSDTGLLAQEAADGSQG